MTNKELKKLRDDFKDAWDNGLFLSEDDIKSMNWIWSWIESNLEEVEGNTDYKWYLTLLNYSDDDENSIPKMMIPKIITFYEKKYKNTFER